MVQGGRQGKKVSTSKRMKMDPCHSVQKKKKSIKVNKRLNVRLETLKPLEKNMRKKYFKTQAWARSSERDMGYIPRIN